MTRIKGLKQGLAGALALGAVAAVPTVVASSQAQQGLAPWQPGGAGGGGAAYDADAQPAAVAAGGSAATPPDWSLSRVLEEVMQQVRQLVVGGSAADEEAGSEEEAEEGWDADLPAAALAAGGLPAFLAPDARVWCGCAAQVAFCRSRAAAAPLPAYLRVPGLRSTYTRAP